MSKDPLKNEFQNRLEAIISTATDGIITISSEGMIESINPAALKLFEYSAEEVMGQNVRILMNNKDAKVHDQYIHNYIHTRIPKIIGIGREVLGKKKSESLFPMRLAVSEVVLHNRVIFTGIIHDLSEIKEAQNELKNINRHLEEKVSERTNELENVINRMLETNQILKSEVSERIKAEKELKESQVRLEESLSKEKELNEMKSRFVSMASHEFRTPLTSILSSASLISKYNEINQVDKRLRHVDKIKGAVSHLTGILNDFLSLSRIEENKIEINAERFKISELLDSVQFQLKDLVKKEQDIIIKELENEYEFISDARIIKNILFNLLSNAIKYSDKDVFCSYEVVDEILKIQIKDEGMGIPEEEQKHLFTRFFRAKNTVNLQGTGLGLYIVKLYLEKLHGEIHFESKLNVGTTFTISIPKMEI